MLIKVIIKKIIFQLNLISLSKCPIDKSIKCKKLIFTIDICQSQSHPVHLQKVMKFEANFKVMSNTINQRRKKLQRFAREKEEQEVILVNSKMYGKNMRKSLHDEIKKNGNDMKKVLITSLKINKKSCAIFAIMYERMSRHHHREVDLIAKASKRTSKMIRKFCAIKTPANIEFITVFSLPTVRIEIN